MQTEAEVKHQKLKALIMLGLCNFEENIQL